MLPSVKRVLIALSILTLIAVSALYFYSKNHTFYNQEEEIGNTPGNIYNGGLFCQQGDYIYFNNISDDGGLYRMNLVCDEIMKISDNKAVYINADEKYLYYILANNLTTNSKNILNTFPNSGIYRLNQNGTGLMAFTGDPSAHLILRGNQLYAQRYDANLGSTLYQYDISGEKERLLYETAAVPGEVIEDFLYYTDSSKNNNIGYTNLLSFTNHSVLKGSYSQPIYMDDYMYYIDEADNKLYRKNIGSNETTLLVKKPCSTYNITNSGKYLYYQISGTKKDQLCRLDLETLKSKTIRKGDFKHIHVTDTYVFFTDSKNKQIYKVIADSNSRVSTFDVPKLPEGTPSPAISR